MTPSEMPKLLYKFMPSSYDGGKTLLPVLKNGHIRFTQPKAMNDPFEIVGGFRDETDYRASFQKYSQEILKAAGRASIRGKKPKVPIPTLVRAFKAIRDSKYLDDGSMAQNAMAHFEELLFNYGILSLSTNWSSSAMWSHYASTHAGICVGLESAMPLFHRGKHQGILSLRPVTYSDDRALLSLTNKTVPNDLFFRKSNDWRYEDEWRVLARFSDLPRGRCRRNGMHNGLEVITLPIELDRVAEILVGACAPPEVEKAALEFARHSSRKVEVFRMRLSATSFKMERSAPL